MRHKNKAIAALMLVMIAVGCTKQDMPNNGSNNGGGNAQNIPMGALNGIFKVSDTKQVRFSKGNLQFKASTNTWRFAESQWSFVGGTYIHNSCGNVSIDGKKCSNDSISPNYNGWIDLFGWGTSGWNSGAVCYEPWSASIQTNDYLVGGSSTNGLYGTYYHADWGSNAITNGGNVTEKWRTLTHDEWLYLHQHNIMFRASVNGVNGLFILPAGFQIPEGMTHYNLDDENWHNNRYNLSGGQRMEANGAVFLPITGCRIGDGFRGSTSGWYWSSTPSTNISGSVYSFEFTGEKIWPGGYCPMRQEGYAVRLVQDVL